MRNYEARYVTRVSQNDGDSVFGNISEFMDSHIFSADSLDEAWKIAREHISVVREKYSNFRSCELESVFELRDRVLR